MLISSVAFAFALALIRKGDLRRLATVRFRLWWLIVAAFVLKLAIVRLSSAGVEWMITYGPALHIATYLALSVGLVLNRDLPWMKLALLGTLLNFAVVAANGGKMPVWSFTLALMGNDRSLANLLVTTDATHTVATDSTVLPWLGDWIPIPMPISSAASPGDVFLALGVILLVNTVTQPSRAPEARPGLAA